MEIKDRIHSVMGTNESVRGIYREVTDERLEESKALGATDRRLISVVEAGPDAVSLQTVPYSQVTGVDIDIDDSTSLTIGVLLGMLLSLLGAILFLAGLTAGQSPTILIGATLVVLGIIVIIVAGGSGVEVEVLVRAADRSDMTYELQDDGGVEWARTLTRTLYNSREPPQKT